MEKAVDYAYRFCRVMLCKRGLCRHASVRLSVTFVNSVKMSNRIFKHFLPFILVFPHQTS